MLSLPWKEKKIKPPPPLEKFLTTPLESLKPISDQLCGRYCRFVLILFFLHSFPAVEIQIAQVTFVEKQELKIISFLNYKHGCTRNKACIFATNLQLI